MEAETLYVLGIALVIAGTIAILATILFPSLSSVKGSGKVKGGGAIIIGPIPIIFGTDKESLRTLLQLSIMLTVLLIAAIIIIHFVLG